MGDAEYSTAEAEDYGPCRWCGSHELVGASDAGTLRQDGREWFECGWCTAAINHYGLYSDDADGYDADEIRRCATRLRCEWRVA